MSKYDKLLFQILRGTADANVPFNDLRHLLISIGFEERIKGSHHIRKAGIVEKINLQARGQQSEGLSSTPGSGRDSEIQTGGRCLMHKYEIIIYWSAEDEAYVADVPELPGCMAHGDTYESAAANANEAIQLWIDTAREFGDPVPEPKGQRLMLA